MDKIVTLQNLNRFHDNILETIQQMIADNNANYHVYCTNEDILRLFDPSIPEEPENPGDYKPEDKVEPDTPVDPEPDTPVDPEPDTPVEPETPIEIVGSISEDNSIVIDETKLENGVYVLQYIDANDNIIENFNSIMAFEINN